MNYFRVRNFEQFQHYKDRRPPWIKLWYSLLRDREFFRLPDETKYHLIGIFLIASQNENCIPADAGWLKHELSATEEINLPLLFDAHFIVDCELNYKEPRADWTSRYIPDWLREKVLKRDKCCVLCRSIENLEIDHITPISKGGKSEECNLQTLCRKCNRIKRFHSMQEIPAQMHRIPCNSGETEAEKEADTEKEAEKSTVNLKKKEEALKTIEIFKHWNNQPATMHHRSLNGQEKAIVKTLRKYSPEEICRAIERYSQVRANVEGRYRDLYQWTLGEFLTRQDHYNIERFNAESWEDPFIGSKPNGSKPKQKDILDLAIEAGEKEQNANKSCGR
jgi:hypothetical protein